MKRYIFFLLLTFVLLAGETAKCVWAVDGDTIYVLRKGKRYKVRLLGVNAPELDSHNPYLRRWAREALFYTASMVVGRRVELEYDREKFDEYGRLLAYVRVKEGLLSKLLIKEGLAWVYRRKEYRLQKELLELERKVKRKKIGLFGDRIREGGREEIKEGRYYLVKGKVKAVKNYRRMLKLILFNGLKLLIHKSSFYASAKNKGVHPGELFLLIRRYYWNIRDFPYRFKEGDKLIVKAGVRLHPTGKEAHIIFYDQLSFH